MTDQIAFPAWPGTTITDEDGTEPVIGWVSTDNGLAAITFDGQRRMIGDYEIGLPDGACVPSPLKGQKATRKRDAEANDKAAAIMSELESEMAAEPSIDFSAKPFATTSWWRYTDESNDFMFEVPPEQASPKKSDACQKIRRVDFDLYKKEGVPIHLYLDVKEGRLGDDQDLPDDLLPAPEEEDDFI